MNALEIFGIICMFFYGLIGLFIFGLVIAEWACKRWKRGHRFILWYAPWRKDRSYRPDINEDAPGHNGS